METSASAHTRGSNLSTNILVGDMLIVNKYINFQKFNI